MTALLCTRRHAFGPSDLGLQSRTVAFAETLIKHRSSHKMSNRIAFVVIILIGLWVTGFGSLFRSF